MTLPEPDEPDTDVVTVTVGRAVQLEQLDALLELPPGTLADLNPELRYKGTPKRAYELRFPAESEEKLVAAIDSIPEWKPPQTQYVVHRVSRGQTLSVIARRYGTSVSAIMRTNNLRSANRIREGQRLRIPVAGSASVRQVSRTAVDGVHTVRRGDTLGAIARAYGTTVSRLKSDNGLSSNTIHPGQELRVGRPRAAGPARLGEPGRRDLPREARGHPGQDRRPQRGGAVRPAAGQRPRAPEHHLPRPGAGDPQVTSGVPGRRSSC